MLKNLEEAKNQHKKNKSESYYKPDLKQFSLFDSNSPVKIHQKKKSSKNFQGKKKDDFFEFQDSNRLTEIDQTNENNINSNGNIYGNSISSF